ncbi:hypothetical protein PspTeo4_37728 [Pseudomonas sp. Teo4]|nr:hypothetical protein [Pseudomonas sp. Teo4]
MKPELIHKDTQELAVTLPNGKTARFEVRTYNELPEGMEGWVGYRPSSDELGIDPLTYLSIIRQGEKLVADIVVEGQPYQLEYLGRTHMPL